MNPLKIIFVGFLVVVAIAAIREGMNSPASKIDRLPITANATASPTLTIAPQEGNDTSPTPHNDRKTMGEGFSLGNFTYTITKAFAVGGIERHFQATLRPAEGAVFVVVEYTIRNDGKSSDDMWVSGFKIQDPQGREFEPSSDVETEIDMRSKRDDAFVKQLHPGIARKLQEGFEIPTECLKQPLVLLVSERGFLSTGVAKVDLVIEKLAKGKKTH